MYSEPQVRTQSEPAHLLERNFNLGKGALGRHTREGEKIPKTFVILHKIHLLSLLSGQDVFNLQGMAWPLYSSQHDPVLM